MNASTTSANPLPIHLVQAEPITKPALETEDTPTIVIDKDELEGDPGQEDETSEDAPTEPLDE